MEADTRKSSDTPQKADHICVLVHGLWGNPTHLDYMASALRERYGEDQLIVLAVKRNSGSFTYDGIELGAERVAEEIEETLDELARDGYKIKKLSIAGYSLGGLVARYAIGLLDHRGVFKNIRPVNFTTFATPHLGVRTPLKGYANNVWNILGARTLSMSGRQLFTIDSFRDTGRPLLSVLADPDSIFIHALALFENRSLYTNVVNDRSAVYYTTGISRTDPYTHIDMLEFHYMKGYEPVLLDPERPVSIRNDQTLPSFYKRLAGGSQIFLKRTPIYLALLVLLPIATVVFMINSGIQTIRSNRRIQFHATKQDSGYRVPVLVQDVRQAVEDAFENVNSAQDQEYLSSGSEEMAEVAEVADLRFKSSESLPSSHAESSPSATASEKSDITTAENMSPKARQQAFPILALTPAQFAMISSLDKVGFRKYPVYIHESRHSHAAIIVRSGRAAFNEGKVVVGHWLAEEFQI